MKTAPCWSWVVGMAIACSAAGGQGLPAPQSAAPVAAPPMPRRGPPPPVAAGAIAGKTVSLTLRNVPLRQALRQLQAQIGVPIEFYPRDSSGGNPNEKPVTLEVKDKPLWEALLAILKQAQAPDDPTIAFGINTQNRGAYDVAGRPIVSGPFMIVASRIVHEAPVQPLGDQPNRITLEMRILIDPTFTLLRLDDQNTPTRATDDRGNNLAPAALEGDSSRLPSANGVPWVNVMLQQPTEAEPGRSITILEGSIAATLLGTETVEVPLGAPFEKKLDGFTMSVEVTADGQRAKALEAPAPPGVYRLIPAVPAGRTALYVLTKVTRDAAAQPPSTILNDITKARVQLLDAGGNAWEQMTQSSSDAKGNERVLITRLMNASSAGSAAKVIVQVPVTNRRVTIPYHFENIPLP